MGFHQPVSRIYLDLVKDAQVIPDTTGVPVPDFGTALPALLEAIQEARQERSHTEGWDGWQLKVVDPSGHVLLSLCLDTPLQYNRGRVPE
jgi:hypothetical protein